MDRYICPHCEATFWSIDAFDWHLDDHEHDEPTDEPEETA